MTPRPRTRWLLLRGLGREKRHWGPFPGLLEAALDASVTCLDLPGFGTEHRRRSPAGVAGIVDDVRRRFAGARGVDRCSILGLSLGGMVALDWCARFPRDFERCVTMNTSASLCAPRERFRVRAATALAASLFGDPVARERTILRVLSRGAHDHEARARQYAVFLADRPPSLSNVARQLVAASRFDLPRTLGVPLLVLGSEGDRLVSPRCSERIAAALDAPVRFHDDAGHELALDDPEWVCETIARWTRSAPRIDRPVRLEPETAHPGASS